VSRFADHPLVRIAEDTAGFVAALEELMARQEQGISADAAPPIAPEHLWQSKADQIIRALDNRSGRI
jgi:hypothetical protein